MMLEISHKKKVTIDYQVATYWYRKTAIGHSKEHFVEGLLRQAKARVMLEHWLKKASSHQGGKYNWDEDADTIHCKINVQMDTN